GPPLRFRVGRGRLTRSPSAVIVNRSEPIVKDAPMPHATADVGEFSALVSARRSLEERFRRLAELFADAAGPLTSGRLPGPDLDQELAAARAAFAAFVGELATLDGHPPSEDLTEASARMESLIAARSVAGVRQRLVGEIAELLRIAHKSDAAFAPLLSYRERLRQRQAECERATTREELDHVEPQLLPFRALFGAVTRLDALDEMGLERIHAEFGPHAVLALMKNRLVLSEPPQASGGREPPEVIAPPEMPSPHGADAPRS